MNIPTTPNPGKDCCPSQTPLEPKGIALPMSQAVDEAC